MEQSHFAGSPIADQRKVVSDFERCGRSGPRKEFETDFGQLTFAGKTARRGHLIDRREIGI